MKPLRQINFQDEEALSRLLCLPKITPNRFSISLPVQDIERALTVACRAQVQKRRGSLAPATAPYIAQAARWIADPQGKPGLLLRGTPGNGKTTLMNALADLINILYASNIRTPDCPEIRVFSFKTRELARLVRTDEGRRELRRIRAIPMVAIDDLGDEPAEVIDFGMTYQPLVEILEHRYERQLFTLLTSNLTSSDIDAHYGVRIRDRLREMCAIIDFQNTTFRK